MNFSIDLSVYEKGRRKPQYTLDTDIAGEVTLQDLLEFTKSSLIIISDEVLKEEQSAGFDKEPILVVDGREGKPITSVSPLGSIEFKAREEIKSILIDTYIAIHKRSPILTGRYKSSNYVFLNGQQVANDLRSFRLWISSREAFDDKDVIRFVNIQPYARKLERLGVTGQRQQSRTVRSRDKRKQAQGLRVVAPNGTYFLTTRSIRSKYKRNVGIRFSFISGSHLGLTASFKAKRNGKPGRPYLYPTITVTVQERGVV